MLLKAVGVGGGVAVLGACSDSSAMGTLAVGGGTFADDGGVSYDVAPTGTHVAPGGGTHVAPAGGDGGPAVGLPAYDGGVIMSSGTLVADAGLMKGLDVHDAGAGSDAQILGSFADAAVGSPAHDAGAGSDAQILGSFADAAVGSPAHDAGFVGDSVDGGGPGGHDATVGGP
jgi:hypothetical protein